jgi:hypothetical protein
MAEGKLATPDWGNATMHRLAEQLLELEALHQSLYLAVDGTLAAEQALYTQPHIMVQDLVPGTYVSRGSYNATLRGVNLVNAGVEFIAKARRLLSYNVTEVTMDRPEVFFVLQDGYTTIRDAMNVSMLLANERSATQGAVITLADFILTLVALVVFTVVSFAAITPAVFRVLAAKQSIFDTLLEVPLPIIRALRARAHKKIEELRRAEEEAEVGLDVAGAGEVDAGDEQQPQPRDGGGGGALDLGDAAALARVTASSAANDPFNAKEGGPAAAGNGIADEDGGLAAVLQAANRKRRVKRG